MPPPLPQSFARFSFLKPRRGGPVMAHPQKLRLEIARGPMECATSLGMLTPLTLKEADNLCFQIHCYLMEMISGHVCFSFPSVVSGRVAPFSSFFVGRCSKFDPWHGYTRMVCTKMHEVYRYLSFTTRRSVKKRWVQVVSINNQLADVN